MNKLLLDYYRCPSEYFRFESDAKELAGEGYFCLGSEITAYGELCGLKPSPVAVGSLPDARDAMESMGSTIALPFDPDKIVENLRREIYAGPADGPASLIASLYYFLRPVLPVYIRRHLQRFRLRDWKAIAFPRWPVDCSVDNLFELLLLAGLRASGARRIPFIWFWPDGKSSCAMMTHDVEARPGYEFCSSLMDIDDSRDIKSSFQVVPEKRYQVTESFLELVRSRGFEVAVHDLDHDGRLYSERDEFLRRAKAINEYGARFKAAGFRAGVLYRNQVWFDALEFEYEMSVPNVARLDPQRGGCCTVMPYFIGNLLELPVTMVQDYTLFHILNSYSPDLWKRQAELIMTKHGMMSFIVHPDYVIPRKARMAYESLLDYLAELRQERDVWIALPREVNQWWRQRAAMSIIGSEAEGWRIVGPGSDRARIAYATEIDGRLAISVESNRVPAAAVIGSHGSAMASA